MERRGGEQDPVADALYRLDGSDPQRELFDRSGLDADTLAGIDAVMTAMGRLRKAEQELADASLRYMKLNATDMRALHYLIVAQQQGSQVTPGALSRHLGISSASTTKLLERLERGGHLTRSAHPADRRAMVVEITPASHRAARETVGRQHARRAVVAAALTPEERATVVRFLDAMAEALTLDPETDWHAPTEPTDR